MPQSPQLAGGEGFTFEGTAAAFYLTALLGESYAPGIDNRIVVRVLMQQRDFGEPLDDIIVDFADQNGNPARLSLQVKTGLIISDAESNTDFRAVVRDSLSTLRKADFRLGVDRYGAVAGTIAAANERDLKTLCDWARESQTSASFEARFRDETGKPTYRSLTDIKGDIQRLLEAANGAPCSAEEVHRFLAHFVLIRFDFLREGATDPADALCRIQECLAAEEATKAPLVWTHLVQLARASAGKAGGYDRPRLAREVGVVARLRGATSLRADLAKLNEIGQSYAALIPDDVGGVRLDRASLEDDLMDILRSARLVQVRGLPGSGKSVVVRRVAQKALAAGPALFLKAEQLEGTSWRSFATAQGLSGATLEEVLIEIGATGQAVLFIDAIDRIEKEHQPIIVDLFRAISSSPLLDQWRIVVSLRDTGIDLLRNWLGDFIDSLGVRTLEVNQLNDEEAETLANERPHLRPLLFGTREVREIVRRPFFAKVLDKATAIVAGGQVFTPSSEIDLIEHWWQRGGYDESGQNALERQRALAQLARARARRLSQPIRLSELASMAHVEGLRTDGILQTARAGVSVRFAHDIFFEWAFFFVLADRGDQWLEEIRACGEPPAVARTVELMAQWEFREGDWRSHVKEIEAAETRPQWLRSWLMGPMASSVFEAKEADFVAALFADDFRLLRKALVWFQAEKTTPNPNILAASLPADQRQRIADMLGWPSDFAAWRRLIDFLLRHIASVPQRLYPDVVAIFEVWQNAASDVPNEVSTSILRQVSAWLTEIDSIEHSWRAPESAADAYWRAVPELEAFTKSLVRLILVGSKVSPSFASEYLNRLIAAGGVRDEVFHDVIAFSQILAKVMPKLLVDLSLKALQQELPADQVARERREREESARWWKELHAKPEDQLTEQERLARNYPSISHLSGGFSYQDWERLCINDDHEYFPASPLREPFQALFAAAPAEALRLFTALCNHAMLAWRQLHNLPYKRRGTPLPLTIAFPWGEQRFWGTEREYLWSRSTWAPKPLACGFLALEDWCLAEMERGRPVDDLIKQVVEGNSCIGVLGIAATVALQAERVSEVTLPLVTSQRLLTADKGRMQHDFQADTAMLIGFDGRGDEVHVAAVKRINARSVRRQQLARLLAGFFFGDSQLQQRARDAIARFADSPPFEYEEQRTLPGLAEQLVQQGRAFAEYMDGANYRAVKTEENGEQVAIYLVSPSASTPEAVARVQEGSAFLAASNLWLWASKGLEEGALRQSFTVAEAVALAKENDSEDLFLAAQAGDAREALNIRRAAVSATAAAVLAFRAACQPDDVVWARGVLGRTARTLEERDMLWSPMAVNPWHPCIFVARGLAAELREDSGRSGDREALLKLVAHPSEAVALVALGEACGLWPVDPRLAWAAMMVALSLCHISPRPPGQQRRPDEDVHSPAEVQRAVDAALAFYPGSGWAPLPLPPVAWERVSGSAAATEEGEELDEVEGRRAWREPQVNWHSKMASNVLDRIPLQMILKSDARTPLLDFLQAMLLWTNAKNMPPWAKLGGRDRRHSRLSNWTHSLGECLGLVSGFLSIGETKDRFLDAIFGLDDDNCWALLNSFCTKCICRFVYDAPAVRPDTVQMLELCLDRLLSNRAFDRESHRGGEFFGFDQPRLVRTLMFVSIERADLAARYVNGDWTEIGVIMPLIDRFVRAAGWAASVMEDFLTLVERARDSYPAMTFADQMLATLAGDFASLKGWRGTFLPARIAGLVQFLAHRDVPMGLELSQKFLRILDILVDMGDRRSAALQLAESFREVQLPARAA